MICRVLIVDDSLFFRKRLKEIINENSELEVVGVAENGVQAVEQARRIKPDVITMDYEMPQMDGITAIRQILKESCIPIVMFSSVTQEGTQITLDALEAGAVDFLLKNFTDVSNNAESLKKNLCNKLLDVAKKSQPACDVRLFSKKDIYSRKNSVQRDIRSSHFNVSRSEYRMSRSGISLREDIVDKDKIHKKNDYNIKLQGKIKLIVIGASTGGPVAVSDIISKLPENFPVPIIVVQHMPKQFTQAFAERLNTQSALNVVLAQDGDVVRTGCVYIAPGGKQLMFDQSGVRIKIIAGDDRVTYKPSVDIALASAAKHFNQHILALILTGMGSDGCEGSQLLKQKMAHIWSQDESSCVVYGMPAAVVKAGLSDAVLPLKEIPNQLINTLM